MSRIHGAAESGARKSTVSASGATARATSSVHGGALDGTTAAAAPKAISPRRLPRAVPKVSVRKTTRALAKRAVPADRWRSASSESATVKVNPGIRTMMPASVAT